VHCPSSSFICTPLNPDINDIKNDAKMEIFYFIPQHFARNYCDSAFNELTEQFDSNGQMYVFFANVP
jgi:hypothetical protein